MQRMRAAALNRRPSCNVLRGDINKRFLQNDLPAHLNKVPLPTPVKHTTSMEQQPRISAETSGGI
jgi:hypothetical protein